jgi:hypothetical protein
VSKNGKVLFFIETKAGSHARHRSSQRAKDKALELILGIVTVVVRQ